MRVVEAEGKVPMEGSSLQTAHHPSRSIRFHFRRLPLVSVELKVEVTHISCCVVASGSASSNLASE